MVCPMAMERINPVGLICGAATGAGPSCARSLARQAQGGLLLADSHEGGLQAVADSLSRAPERVSTLAFDIGNEVDWRRATDFIAAHYGRLDWAIICPRSQHIQEPDGLIDIDTAQLAVRSAAALLRNNIQGGAIVVVVGARAAMKAQLLHFLSTADEKLTPHRIRINAIVCGDDTPLWRSVPLLPRVDHASFDRLRRAPEPIARCPGYDVEWMLPHLLSDETLLTGAALVVDAPQTL